MFNKKEYMHNWRIKNSKRLIEYDRARNKTPERKAREKKRWKIRYVKQKEYKKTWLETETGKRYKERTKENIKRWRQTPKGKIFYRELSNKRQRFFKYNILNPELGAEPDFEGHHIDRNNVIYIPKKIHRSIWHSQKKPETIEQINTKSYCWLLGMGEMD